MFSIMTLPANVLRMLVVVALLSVAYFKVLPKHPRAGLILMGGAALDLATSIAIPIMEVMGFGLVVSQGSSNSGDPVLWPIFAVMMLQWVPPVAAAFNLGCFTAAIWMLASAVEAPAEDRSFGDKA